MSRLINNFLTIPRESVCTSGKIKVKLLDANRSDVTRIVLLAIDGRERVDELSVLQYAGETLRDYVMF